jgi:hypothetical protein
MGLNHETKITWESQVVFSLKSDLSSVIHGSTIKYILTEEVLELLVHAE